MVGNDDGRRAAEPRQAIPIDVELDDAEPLEQLQESSVAQEDGGTCTAPARGLVAHDEAQRHEVKQSRERSNGAEYRERERGRNETPATLHRASRPSLAPPQCS